MLTPAARSSRSRSQVDAPRVRVHAGGRLVEEDQLGPADQRPGQVDRLLLPAGQPTVRRTSEVGDAQPLHQRAELERVGVQAGQVAEQLTGLDARPGAGALRHQPDPGRRLAADPAGGPETEIPTLPGRISPVQQRSSVVLPAPFGPSTAVKAPGSARSDNPSSTARPPSVTDRSSTTSAASGRGTDAV